VKKSTWIWFSLMRLAAFAIPLVIMLLLGGSCLVSRAPRCDYRTLRFLHLLRAHS